VKNWADIASATNAQILAWAETQPWAREMASCQQDSQWHAEGDVWTHTRLVCSELEHLPEWDSFSRVAQLKLLFAALFHDVGKPATSSPDPETGRIRSPKHAVVGSEIARRVLRDLGCDLQLPLETLLARNRRRANPVPEKVILSLLENLEPPTITEWHDFVVGTLTSL